MFHGIYYTKIHPALNLTYTILILLYKSLSDSYECYICWNADVVWFRYVIQPSWVTEEEFTMGFVDLKPAPSAAASKSVHAVPPTTNISPSETANGRTAASSVQHHDSGASLTSRTKPSESKHEKMKGGSLSNGSDVSLLPGQSRSVESQKQTDDTGNRVLDESPAKGPVVKRSAANASVPKQPKQDLGKTEAKPKPGGSVHEPSAPAKGSTRSSDPETGVSKLAESRKDDLPESSDAQRRASSRPTHSPRPENSYISKTSDKPTKRTSPAEEQDRFLKRRKGEHDSRDVEPEARLSDRERLGDPRALEDEPIRSSDKHMDKLKNERYDREYRDRFHGDDAMEKSRDRSMERYSRERSVDRDSDKGCKDDRNKGRYSDNPADRDDRFRGQSLPPPPPLPPHVVPQSLNANRRDEDPDRRFGTARHSQRLSPRHDDRERRRSEENMLLSQEEAKRRREEEIRDRKREGEEREGFSNKVIYMFPLLDLILYFNFTSLFSLLFIVFMVYEFMKLDGREGKIWGERENYCNEGRAGCERFKKAKTEKRATSVFRAW